MLFTVSYVRRLRLDSAWNHLQIQRYPIKRTRFMMFRYLPLLLALALCSAAAQAQGMYRSVMPDGKIVYGDKPAPGAKESKKLNLAPLNIATPPPAPDTVQSTNPADTAPVDKNAEVAAARQRLEAAQKALNEGREQREGDRIGVAKGGGATSRLSDSYLQRVKALEDAVAAAQQQLEAAQRNVQK
jgi:hypothetical protein